jgi:hypothetical protein
MLLPNTSYLHFKILYDGELGGFTFSVSDKSQVNIFELHLSKRSIKQYIVKYVYTSDVITRAGYILLVLVPEKIVPFMYFYFFRC